MLPVRRRKSNNFVGRAGKGATAERHPGPARPHLRRGESESRGASNISEGTVLDCGEATPLLLFPWYGKRRNKSGDASPQSKSALFGRRRGIAAFVSLFCPPKRKAALHPPQSKTAPLPR